MTIQCLIFTALGFIAAFTLIFLMFSSKSD
jgi:hypothetical protein